MTTIRIEYETWDVKEQPVWAKALWPDGTYIIGAGGATPEEARANVIEKAKQRIANSLTLPPSETIEI
jgi:hypothetical protein